MTTAELTSQFDFLVNSVDRQNADILQKAVDALNKVLHPKAKKRITKDDMSISPAMKELLDSMTLPMQLPDDYDYREEKYEDYMKG